MTKKTYSSVTLAEIVLAKDNTNKGENTKATATGNTDMNKKRSNFKNLGLLHKQKEQTHIRGGASEYVIFMNAS